MRPFLVPPRTNSHQIWAWRFFIMLPRNMVFQTLKNQKGDFITSVLHFGLTCIYLLNLSQTRYIIIKFLQIIAINLDTEISFNSENYKMSKILNTSVVLRISFTSWFKIGFLNLRLFWFYSSYWIMNTAILWSPR